MRSSGFRSGQERIVLWVVGFVIVIAVGVGLVWFGFALGRRRSVSPEPSDTPAATTASLPSPTATTVPPPPTDTPLPTVTPLPPTPASPIPTPVTARIVAGEDGSNVRSGPGTGYEKLGYLDPGTEARVIGRYEDWWQIEYEGAPGWVYNEVCEAFDTENVPEVQPASPPPTEAPAPTQPPPEPTNTPAPTEPSEPPAGLPGVSSDLRGLYVSENGYQVPGAPGPYAAGQCIKFFMWIDNNSGEEIVYEALGTWVYETEQFQKSYFAVPPHYPSFVPGQKFAHDDCITIPNPGTYHLYLAIHFKDGTPALLYGPVEIVVQ
jgi:hypothetical protein